MSDVTDELTPDEVQELQKYLTAGAPSPEDKHNVHKFLADVATSADTTKTGFLSGEEVGIPKHPTRTYKNLSLIAGSIMENPFISDFYNQEAEILTATSLSKEAKLLQLAITTQRQLADVTSKAKTKNKSWFKKKGEGEES